MVAGVYREMSVMVLGACLRLNKWHGAQVTLLVARKDEENDTCQLWKTVLHADIQNTEERISLKIPVWRGTISIQVSQITALRAHVCYACFIIDNGQCWYGLVFLCIHIGCCLL